MKRNTYNLINRCKVNNSEICLISKILTSKMRRTHSTTSRTLSSASTSTSRTCASTRESARVCVRGGGRFQNYNPLRGAEAQLTHPNLPSSPSFLFSRHFGPVPIRPLFPIGEHTQYKILGLWRVRIN